MKLNLHVYILACLFVFVFRELISYWNSFPVAFLAIKIKGYLLLKLLGFLYFKIEIEISFISNMNNEHNLFKYFLLNYNEKRRVQEIYEIQEFLFQEIIFQWFTAVLWWYWLLYSGNGGMTKGNKHSLFFRFFICRPRTGSFSTCFALLKLRSKDSIRHKHFVYVSPLLHDLLFEIEKTMIYVAYISPFSFFVVRVLCRR